MILVRDGHGSGNGNIVIIVRRTCCEAQLAIYKNKKRTETWQTKKTVSPSWLMANQAGYIYQGCKQPCFFDNVPLPIICVAWLITYVPWLHYTRFVGKEEDGL